MCFKALGFSNLYMKARSNLCDPEAFEHAMSVNLSFSAFAPSTLDSPGPASVLVVIALQHKASRLRCRFDHVSNFLSQSSQENRE